MKARHIINRLDLDISEKSGRVRETPSGKPCPELFIAFPLRGCMWVRMNGSYVSGWTDHGAYHGQQFGLINRLRIRAAVRRWLARTTQTQEPV